MLNPLNGCEILFVERKKASRNRLQESISKKQSLGRQNPREKQKHSREKSARKGADHQNCFETYVFTAW